RCSNPCQQQVDPARPQYAELLLRAGCENHVMDNAGILAAKSFQDGREQAGSECLPTPNSNLTCGGIGEELDLLHALLKLVEDGYATLEKRTAINCSLDALRVAIEKAH